MSGPTTVLPGARAPAVGQQARSSSKWSLWGFGCLVAIALVGFVLYPTYPTYDSYYALVWGRELLHGQLPTLAAYRAPTQHPFTIGVGALLALFGQFADRLMIALMLGSLVLLVAGIYRLGRVAFTQLVGGVAAALLLTRLDFPFLALRGFIDVPYLAAVIWAGAWVAEQPRRGGRVLGVLALAGLMRPEAWLLAAAYFAWLVGSDVWAGWSAGVKQVLVARWRPWLGFALLTAIGPLLWAGLDWVVTGDPTFSLTYTSGMADQLARSRSIGAVPGLVPQFIIQTDKLPVAAAGAVGVLLAVLMAPRRALMPLLLVRAGIGTFTLVGIAGLSMIPRYLVVSSVALLVFSAFAFGGWSLLERGVWLRQVWAGVAATILITSLIFTVTHLNFSVIDKELRYRGSAQQALVSLLREPSVQASFQCGPISVPNHKLVPAVRWITGLRERQVIARSQYQTASGHTVPELTRGVAIFPLGVDGLNTSAFTNPETMDTSLVQTPLTGFHRVASNNYYSVYVRCR